MKKKYLALKINLKEELEKGHDEYVIKNLALQLDKNLQARYGKNVPIAKLLLTAYKSGDISREESNFLNYLILTNKLILNKKSNRDYSTAMVWKWIDTVFNI